MMVYDLFIPYLVVSSSCILAFLFTMPVTAASLAAVFLIGIPWNESCSAVSAFHSRSRRFSYIWIQTRKSSRSDFILLSRFGSSPPFGNCWMRFCMNLSRSLIVSFMMFRFLLCLGFILISSPRVIVPALGLVLRGSLVIPVFFHQV